MKALKILRAMLGRDPAAPPDFSGIFSRFREVLARHNAAMEVIAEMGEKLGGDYIFDINYLRPSYERLRGHVLDTLSGFSELTGGGHQALEGSFMRIDEEIRRLLYEVPSQSGTLVVDLKDITWDMAGEVGGKGLNLAEVKNGAGLPVPEGFAVTARAFEMFMDHNALIPLLSEDMDEERLEEVRGRILRGQLPQELSDAFEAALGRLVSGRAAACRLAVRSSAVGEDGDFSFAGQFRSLLNVDAGKDSFAEAYKGVLASLFTPKAAAYLRRLGTGPETVKMGVCCLLMVDARSSGVVYSSDPSGDDDAVLISSSWGTGEAVVEGMVEADQFVAAKTAPVIRSRRIGRKGAEGADASPSITDEEAVRLAGIASRIERYFRVAQDIEWAIDREGNIMILQSRPLRREEGAQPSRSGEVGLSLPEPLLRAGAVAVQRGVGAGKVFVVRGPADLEDFPRGGVLVAGTDSSDLVKVMPYASAVITETGSPTSHMASLCREFRLPAVLGAGSSVRLLSPGHEVTVVADDGAMTVYEGIIRELLTRPASASMDELYEYRRKRYMLRYITPLNLIDPLADEFRADRCRTVHDILRFVHEKSVMHLIDAARAGADGQKAVRLDLPVPAGIIVVDMGGGMEVPAGRKNALMEEIVSRPFRALLEGMTHPGVWHAETVSLTARDFMGSMMRMPDIMSGAGQFASGNLAVVAKDYVSLGLRFGYHFTVIDCYCGETMRNNHLYFRFGGGATDMVKRSRRVELIGRILRELGFGVAIKADLLTARLANTPMDEMLRVLDMTGRVIAYTRQLDAVLQDDSDVELHVRKFLAGDYSLYI